jgi:hypothetical protein
LIGPLNAAASTLLQALGDAYRVRGGLAITEAVEGLGGADDAFDGSSVAGAEEGGQIELAGTRGTGSWRTCGVGDAKMSVGGLDQAFPAAAGQRGAIGLG